MMQQNHGIFLGLKVNCICTCMYQDLCGRSCHSFTFLKKQAYLLSDSTPSTPKVPPFTSNKCPFSFERRAPCRLPPPLSLLEYAPLALNKRNIGTSLTLTGAFTLPVQAKIIDFSHILEFCRKLLGTVLPIHTTSKPEWKNLPLVCRFFKTTVKTPQVFAGYRKCWLSNYFIFWSHTVTLLVSDKWHMCTTHTHNQKRSLHGFFQ